MRILILFCCAFLSSLRAQTVPDFSGTWSLNQARSDVRDFLAPPARMLNVEQSGAAMTVSASVEPGVPPTRLVCPIDGSSKKNQVGDSTWNVASKWEGPALLLNIIVSGPSNYSVFERWAKAPDGNSITVSRTVNRGGNESESVFVYENPKAPLGSPAPVRRQVTEARRPAPVEPIRRAQAPATAATAGQQDEYVVAAGTRVLMRLTSPVDTKHSAVGDRVYLETAVPVFVNSRMIIPSGSYVTGRITEAQRAGRVKGKAALNLRFEALTLPNGISRDFMSRAGSVEAQGNLDRQEGRITGEGKGGSGTKTVAQTTASGAGLGGVIGAATGHVGSGLGIGAAAGAAAGLAGVFGKRGEDVVLRQGTTIELVLDRDLYFTPDDLKR
jgi:hypothetical protein